MEDHKFAPDDTTLTAVTLIDAGGNEVEFRIGEMKITTPDGEEYEVCYADIEMETSDSLGDTLVLYVIRR